MKCKECGVEYPSKYYFARPSLCTDCFDKIKITPSSNKQKTCPECYNPMFEKRDFGITIDECSICKGIWFDAGELETYRLAKGERRETAETTLSHFKPQSDDQNMTCPVCLSDTLQCGGADTLQIARCTQCSGIYVCEKEVKKISKERESKELNDEGEGKFWIGAAILEFIWEFVDG